MGERAASRDVRRVPRPDPRPPKRPVEPAAPVRLVRPAAPSAPTVAVQELGSEHLVSLPDDTEVRIRRLIAEELTPTRPGRNQTTLRLDRLSPRGVRLIAVGAIVFALVWNVAIGVFHVTAQTRREEPSGDATSLRAAAIALPPAAAVVHQCTVGSPRLLARSVLLRGGVEATADEDRIALGIVKGPKEGVALELEPGSGVVKASMKVVASDALLRVLPAVEGEVPLDAIPDVGGPLHAIGGAGDDGECEAGVQGGFLVWRTRGVSARLWPMATDVEVPRVARVGRDRVLVFRRDDAIWAGAVQGDGDAARPGGLARVSEGPCR